MSDELLTGYILQERVVGVDRWVHTNAHVYPDKDILLDYADRRVRVEGIEEVRIVEIEHRPLRVVMTISEEEK